MSYAETSARDAGPASNRLYWWLADGWHQAEPVEPEGSGA